MMYTNKQLLQLTLPLFAEQFLIVFVGVADTFMVSYAGEAAVSGVALVDTISFLITAVLGALCTGGAVVASQYLGSGDRQKVALTGRLLLGGALLIGLVILAGVELLGAPALRLIFGEQELKDWNAENIDWNAVDSQLISQRILVTRPEINGRKLSSLRLRNNYGINISRVYRSGVQLLATPDLRLQMGDRLTVVGEAAAIQNVEKILGNAVKNLDEPNLVAVFVGLILGLVLGSIPVSIPGISLPVKLGLAGGPIVIGILIGTFGPRLHMITYTTYSANLMLRALGLSMYLACLGLEAGAHFFETVMRPEGALWLLLGFLLTFVPVVLLGVFALRVLRIDFGSVSGMLCGSMANPMALTYANDTIEGDNPSVSYATVYPLCMFLRVVIIQVMLMIFL